PAAFMLRARVVIAPRASMVVKVPSEPRKKPCRLPPRSTKLPTICPASLMPLATVSRPPGTSMVVKENESAPRVGIAIPVNAQTTTRRVVQYRRILFPLELVDGTPGIATSTYIIAAPVIGGAPVRQPWSQMETRCAVRSQLLRTARVRDRGRARR